MLQQNWQIASPFSGDTKFRSFLLIQTFQKYHWVLNGHNFPNDLFQHHQRIDLTHFNEISDVFYEVIIFYGQFLMILWLLPEAGRFTGRH